jgi:hypothetical protein
MGTEAGASPRPSSPERSRSLATASPAAAESSSPDPFAPADVASMTVAEQEQLCRRLLNRRMAVAFGHYTPRARNKGAAISPTTTPSPTASSPSPTASTGGSADSHGSSDVDDISTDGNATDIGDGSEFFGVTETAAAGDDTPAIHEVPEFATARFMGALSSVVAAKADVLKSRRDHAALSASVPHRVAGALAAFDLRFPRELVLAVVSAIGSSGDLGLIARALDSAVARDFRQLDDCHAAVRTSVMLTLNATPSAGVPVSPSESMEQEVDDCCSTSSISSGSDRGHLDQAVLPFQPRVNAGAAAYGFDPVVLNERLTAAIAAAYHHISHGETAVPATGACHSRGRWAWPFPALHLPSTTADEVRWAATVRRRQCVAFADVFGDIPRIDTADVSPLPCAFQQHRADDVVRLLQAAPADGGVGTPCWRDVE